MAKWRNAIDLSLLQMATGLRQTEGRRIDWPLIQVDDQEVMSVAIPEHVAKTKEARVVLVLEPRVAEHILERYERTGGEGFVIGAPSDPSKIWHRSNCVAAVAELYKKAAAELEMASSSPSAPTCGEPPCAPSTTDRPPPRCSTPSSVTPKRSPTSTTPTTTGSTTWPTLPDSARRDPSKRTGVRRTHQHGPACSLTCCLNDSLGEQSESLTAPCSAQKARPVVQIRSTRTTGQEVTRKQLLTCGFRPLPRRQPHSDVEPEGAQHFAAVGADLVGSPRRQPSPVDVGPLVKDHLASWALTWAYSDIAATAQTALRAGRAHRQRPLDTSSALAVLIHSTSLALDAVVYGRPADLYG